ncbi:hypothetical protein ABZ499_27675 [Streptomyces sp. NPDC019990]|uniref:hypothetical protein n=1 Tax=Streptomyces sp. NPDC019990 TaxID=3154693 RepID=UPI0033F8C7FC
MYQSAEDDAERRRIEAKLYAPPKALRRPRAQRAVQPQQPQRGALTVQDAKSLMAQLAAQDAQLGLG